MKKSAVRLISSLFAVIILTGAASAAAQAYSLLSPDKTVEVKISLGNTLTYEVLYKGRPLIAPSAVSMTLGDGTVLGRAGRVKSDKRRSSDVVLKPFVRQKAAEIRDKFNELKLEFRGDYAFIVRAYDDGVAYRFATALKKPITVVSEQAEFTFTADHTVYWPQEDGFQTHQERAFKPVALSAIDVQKFASAPAVVAVEGGPKVAVTEADLESYAGLYLARSADFPMKLVGVFPAYPAKEEARNDRNIVVTAREPFLAKTAGTRSFPWRVLMIAGRDGDLIESPMIYRLAKPAGTDFAWVKPGKVAWDWWNDLNISGVEFRAGVNTETYKHYIDFASENGIEYVILDEGWYKLGDLLSVNPALDMPAVLAYAKAKNVGVILWVVWKTLDNQFQAAMDQFSRWGVQGLKIDFMQRDDQPVVDFYYKVAAEAAKRHFLVDFHGAYKPTGLYRTFPNVLTSEGVMGLEHSKWSRDITPEHDVTLPFTRMFAGPMDFTPGAMLNGGMKNFQIIYNRPMSQGTRCHQLAMYVVYESPLQMLADSPTNYRREPTCLAFLSKVPTVWDETRVLDAKLGDYVVVARRSGRDWYIGAMTDATERTLTLDLSFLEQKEVYAALIYQDGVNADRDGNDFTFTKQSLLGKDPLTIRLAPGGGWAARIIPLDIK
ncbi:MAG: glycoside hydrolase family 97 protein [Candidatus Aminicenantes bacterium]|nr:glycoside hydrolase family 97 protein [Candidatus Aminicenantes bacterium]